MIGRAERSEWAASFGVAPEQIERDHLISHLLAALGEDTEPDEVFYGGTALCRSHLERTRLSEDVDLLHPNPGERIDAIQRRLRTALRREFPDLEWSGSERGPERASALVRTGDVAPIRLDVRRPDAVAQFWEFTATKVYLRYRDLPDTATLRCPTLETFAAMKMAAWSDRHAPRDLFDLAGLSDLGALTPVAERRLRGAGGRGFLAVDFTAVPRSTLTAWETELGAQVGNLPTPEACADRVLRSIRSLHP